ncbi:hypothetical protein QR680_008043 [Steinernema hermaphroditum]|uniref:TATA box-binding protein-like 1 n=1 Tax=Steinernema hermaphroditum TaxID=289476 RepID=A0AA39IGQ2_9BILA|nr:hypothetical protein QR680_008043 [Steinernema hermaphroditum]
MGYQAPSSFQIGHSAQAEKRSKSSSYHAPQIRMMSRTNSSGYRGTSTSYHQSPYLPFRGIPSFPSSRLPIPTQPYQYQSMPSTSYGPYTPYGYGPIPPPTFKIGAGRERPKEKASGGSGGSKKSSLQETKEVGKVYVQNIVVTAKMRIGRGAVRQDRDDLNLRVLAMIIPNTQYRPEKFAALRVALRKPHASVNVFRTGQMVCVGARSFEDAKRAIRTVARKIQKIKVTTQEGVQQPRYPELELLYIKVQNIVATVHMGFKIDLDALCADGEHNGNVTYNPEQFTAMTFAIKQPKVSANIFSNGKLNLLGAKSMSDLVNAHEQVATVLNRYRKVSVEEATTKKKVLSSSSAR